MDFKKIDNQYRPVPFWSWNEKLETKESRRQVELMEEAGIGGYFMHARGGLQTEYMGDEWFDNVSACIEEGDKRGMHAWAYDENGWPSGFGGGLVNGKGIRFQQKYLRHCPIGKNEPTEDRVICRTAELCFYYDVNPFYVDTLDGEVIADFIREIYEPYYVRYGSRFDGFFTDEPQISRNGIPWSFILPAEYEKAYGEPIFDRLPELYFPVGDYRVTRMRFWKLVTELFSKNFMKQIYDWCHAHDLQFTGHLVLEERLAGQLPCNGACMPHYEYLDIPGMDWLGRPIYRCLTAHQVASVAAQTGKKQILSETFAMCGHNIGHDELKRNYEWMMVRGINLLCQHLEGYSLRGIRKRDYPPAMYVQQPWWQDYKVFNDAMSRVGMLLAEGEIDVETLVIHPQTTAWMCFDNVDTSEIRDYNQKLLELLDVLEQKHIPFHLGDEILMERHGRVEDGKLLIGEMRYGRVILPPHLGFFENTERLLAEFKSAGGKLVTAEELPANNIVDDPRITYTKRVYPADGFTMHYFVNSTEDEIDTVFSCNGKILDIATGELLPFDGTYRFPKWGSLVIIDDGTPTVVPIAEDASPSLPLDGAWKVVGATENALTLDKCTYYFDGELQEDNGYILNVGNRALSLERPVDILCRFRVEAEFVPETLYLACETPEIFEITVNGQAIDTKNDCGFFRDHAFRKLDISGMMKAGENIIETSVRFAQSDVVYENLKKARVFESEKNKLTYDMEIEAMYLVGDFGVKLDGETEEIENDAMFFDGKFVLTEPPKSLTLAHIERQGYPFFAGELTVERTFSLDAPRTLRFSKKGINALRVNVNGADVSTLLWAPYECSLASHLQSGENTVRFTLVNNLRNLLGPHHHRDGELLSVSPRHFYKEACVWTPGGEFTEKYCFVETSIYERGQHMTSAIYYVNDHRKNGISDSEAVRECLAEAKAEPSRTIVFSGEDYLLSEAVLLPSHTCVIIRDCALQLENDIHDNLFRGENVQVDPDAPFGLPLSCGPLADIRILGEGKAVLRGPDRNPVGFHPVLQEEQEMVGDFWGWRTHLVSLTRCEGFEVGGFAVEKTRGWAVCFDLCRKGHLHDLHFASNVKNGDGIDLRSGCHHVLIERITGITSDDSVACTAIWNAEDRFPVGNYLYPHEPGYCIQERTAEEKNISHVTIREVNTAGRHHAVICLVACGCQVHDILVESICEPMHADWRESVVKLYTGYGSGYTAGDLHDITVKDISASYSKFGVYCNAEVQNVTLAQIIHPKAERAVALDCPSGVKLLKEKGEKNT